MCLSLPADPPRVGLSPIRSRGRFFGIRRIVARILQTAAAHKQRRRQKRDTKRKAEQVPEFRISRRGNHIRPPHQDDRQEICLLYTSTVATEAWYTGYHPYTLQPVFSAKSQKEKLAQRMFFFWYKPEERRAIINELRKIGRADLIDKLYGK